MSNETYVSDAPIAKHEEDRFRRWPFAERIADSIAAQPDPSSMVIAIYGAWGTGKTTVLNFVEEALANKENVATIQYNPWRFSSEAQMLSGFLHLLADTLGRSIKTKKEKIAEAISTYGKCVAPLLPGAECGAGAIGELAGVSLAEQKMRISDVLIEEGKKVVVLIDDIDRLDKAEIQVLFRLVKLTADFKNMVYVLAFDHDVVAASLGERYGEGGLEAGASFLEKIIQVPLDLPAVNQEALRKYALNCLEQALMVSKVELSEKQAQEFWNHYTRGIEPCLTTPRVCKRYANALSFALPILGDEINPVDLMVLEGVRILFPKLYKTLALEKQTILQSVTHRQSSGKEDRESLKKVVDKSLADSDDTRKQAAISMIRGLLPQVSSIFGGSGYDQERWEPVWSKEKRVASRRYFDRYFEYAIPAGDIPDRVVCDLLSALPAQSPEKLGETLASLVETHGAEPLVDRLRASAGQLSPKASTLLAEAVVRVAPTFPRPETLVSFETPFAQAAILVGNLVRNLPADKRLECAKGLFEQVTFIPFALELFSWVRPFKDDSDSTETAMKEYDDALGPQLAQRIEAEARCGDLLSGPRRDLSNMLWAWKEFGEGNAAARYLEDRIASEPASAAKLLMAYVPSGWSSSGKTRGDFRRPQYDRVAEIVDPEKIFQALRVCYGDVLDDPRDRHAEFKDAEEWVAHQFCALRLTPVPDPKAETAEGEVEAQA